jgi:hypothetical protein
MPGDTRNHERDQRAWALRLSGATYPEIGAALGVSMQRAQQICARMLKEHSVSSEQVETHRATELARLDRMQRAIWPEALKGNLGAVDRSLRLSERRSKLLGLDAPTQQTIQHSGLELNILPDRTHDEE